MNDSPRGNRTASSVTRRTVLGAGAWGVPAIVATAASPAWAASALGILSFDRATYSAPVGSIIKPIVMLSSTNGGVVPTATIRFNLTLGLEWADGSREDKFAVVQSGGSVEVPEIRLLSYLAGEQSIRATSTSATPAEAVIESSAASNAFVVSTYPGSAALSGLSGLIHPETGADDPATDVYTDGNDVWVIAASGNVYAGPRRTGVMSRRLALPSRPVDVFQGQHETDGMRAGILCEDATALFLDVDAGTIVRARGIGDSRPLAVSFTRSSGWVFCENGDIYAVDVTTGAAVFWMTVGARVSRVFQTQVTAGGADSEVAGIVAEDGTAYFVSLAAKSATPAQGLADRAEYVFCSDVDDNQCVITESGRVYSGSMRTGATTPQKSFSSRPRTLVQCASNFGDLGAFGMEDGMVGSVSSAGVNDIKRLSSNVDHVFAGISRTTVIDSIGDVHVLTYRVFWELDEKHVTIGGRAITAHPFQALAAGYAGVVTAPAVA